MTAIKPRRPLAFSEELSELPAESRERHEAFVDMFGRFLFWLRNWTLASTRRLLDPTESRENLRTVQRQYYDRVASLPPNERDAATRVAEDTLNAFCQHLLWVLGDQGIDSRLGKSHAYRFRVTMEIVDVETHNVIEEVVINRGGTKFFGDYWGKWLNRHRGQAIDT